MPAPTGPFLSPTAIARMVETSMAMFNALDARDLSLYGIATPPLANFMRLMREQSGRGFRIRRQGPDDMIIEDRDGVLVGPAITGEGTDAVWALVEAGLAEWTDQGILQLAERPPDHRLNMTPARRRPEETRPGLRVDFIPGTDDNDF